MNVQIGERNFLIREQAPLRGDYFCASFENAVFCSSMTLSFSKIHAGTSFFGATVGVEQRGVLDQRADFQFCEFHGHVLFSFSQICVDASFEFATFNNDFICDQAKFEGQARFMDCTFSGDATFQKALFQGHADFERAKFGKESPSEPTLVDFSKCSFEKTAGFRKSQFLSRYPVFVGANIEDRAIFTAVPKYWPREPKDRFANMEDGRRWIDEARDSCASIRHSLSKQGLHEDEHFFFRREMAFAASASGWWGNLPFRLFGLVSDYGNSIEKPLKLLLTTVVAPSGVFTGYLQTLEGSYNCLDALHWIPAGLGMSFSNTFKFLGLQRLHFAEAFEAAGTAIHAVAGVQTVLGFVFLFFLGLGLRQRFRLR